jgi:hypothetical protein
MSAPLDGAAAAAQLGLNEIVLLAHQLDHQICGKQVVRLVVKRTILLALGTSECQF